MPLHFSVKVNPLHEPAFSTGIQDLHDFGNDWKTELHVSRMIARLIVDNQPALVCVHPATASRPALPQQVVAGRSR